MKSRVLFVNCVRMIVAATVLASWVGGAGRAAAQEAPFDLAAALAAAEPGAIITVPAGTYPGPLVLDKSVTLVGEGRPVIQGAGAGDVVTITAPDVTLDGFVVRGTGDSLDKEDAGIKVQAPRATVTNNLVEDALFGIYLANAPDSVVRNNEIVGKDLPISRRGDALKIWYSANSLAEGNHIRDSRDTLVWFSPGVVMRKNLIERNRYGLHYMQTDDQIIEDNVVRDNSVGIYLMYGRDYELSRNLMANNRGSSGYGLGLKEVNDVVIDGNRLVNNRVGVYSDGSPIDPATPVRFQKNLFAYNENGMELLPNIKGNQFVDNIFLDNNVQIAVAGVGDVLRNDWSVAGRGNYWSDYAGFDADGDQVGDLPYQSKSLYEDLLGSHPELRLFQLGPATDALDLAARAFPIFEPHVKMADPHPLTAPPMLPEVPGLPEPPVVANFAAAAGMIALAALLLVAGLRLRWK
jgi:nitrous oxidase accessory protein